MTEQTFIGRKGLELDAPAAGDIVTVLIRPPSANRPQPTRVDVVIATSNQTPDHENPSHYRVTAFWRVIAVNGGHAVVECLTGYSCGYREMWSIAQHRWFEASELYEAMTFVQAEAAEPEQER